jgi:mannose-6-phosphate isomerase-like protein (cupin superfamily)
MNNVTVVHTGPWTKLASQVFTHGPLRKLGKMFLGEQLGSTSAEISVNRIEPGDGYEFLHRHRTHEEVYLVIAGSGDMLVDGEQIAISEGTVVRVSPDGVRSIRAAVDSALTYLCIQAVSGTLRQYTVTDGELVPGVVNWSSSHEQA